MSLLSLTFYMFVLLTIEITLVCIPIHGFALYFMCKRKGQKHNWMNFIPGLCLYPMILLCDREFRLFGFIKLKNRKKAALYYIISNLTLLLFCIISKMVLSSYNNLYPALWANIHFISLILYLIQLIAFRLRAFYDLFMTYDMQESATSLAALSIIYPIIFVMLAFKMERNYSEKLKKSSISPEQNET